MASSYDPEGFGREERPPCQLYLISPPEIDLDAHAQALQRALAAGTVAAYQLRLKGLADDRIVAAARALRDICAAHDVAFILNDRMDLAQAAGADGVHLGQEDGSVAEARQLLGREAQIGVTCHASRHLAIEAAEGGADYVAFGAFFATRTKVVEHMAQPDILRWWTSFSPVPCVAIGGITVENCAPLVVAGADFLAVSAAVWNTDPARAVADFERAMRPANGA